MNDYNTWLQTITAISAAIAAIFAAYVARKAFAFQQNALLKKAIIEQIVKLLEQMYYLKLLASPCFTAADDVVTGLKDRIIEARNSVIMLESMTSASTSKELAIVREVISELREDRILSPDDKESSLAIMQQLDDAIRALQMIYRKETK